MSYPEKTSVPGEACSGWPRFVYADTTICMPSGGRHAYGGKKCVWAAQAARGFISNQICPSIHLTRYVRECQPTLSTSQADVFFCLMLN